MTLTFGLTLALATASLLILVAFAGQAMPGRVAAAAVDYRVLVQEHVDAINRGDVDAVMATYSDDAVVSGGGGLCEASPCAGKAAIRRDIERLAASHTRFTMFSLQESNGKGVGRAEVSDDFIRSCGVSRILTSFNLDVRNDKVSSVRIQPDLTDPQTMAFLACVARATAPQPQIAPPRTGDGGLTR